jgi:predicted acylesterase/phospholipase RssA
MIKNIIFSGGGLKGWAYIGTIKALDEYVKLNDIKTVSGTSIGSVFGLFYIIGIKWDFLLDFFINLDFKSMVDIDIDNILINQSVMKGNKYKQLVQEIMSIKIDPEITFMGLHKYSKILYSVTALNISNCKVEYFNYLTTPDVKVIDAILASSSLPFLFPAYKIKDKYYYDGGICNNCPTNLVDELESIAFDIGFFSNELESNFKILNLLNSLSFITNSNFSKNEKIIFKILDSKFNNEAININQSKDDVFNIFMNGYLNSKNVIFDNFLALPSNETNQSSN